MKRLTAKEEEILGCFWKEGPLFIRQLLDLFDEPKPHYNTLSTIVRGLEDKGFIGYKIYGNTYQYYAIVTENEYRKNTLGGIVSRYFNNSYTNVVSSLIEDDRLSVEELQQLLREIEKNK